MSDGYCLSCGDSFSIYSVPVRLQRCNHYFCGNCVNELDLSHEGDYGREAVACPFCQTLNPRTQCVPNNRELLERIKAREEMKKRLFGTYAETCVLYFDEDQDEGKDNNNNKPAHPQ